jgi:hypothetical protein
VRAWPLPCAVHATVLAMAGPFAKRRPRAGGVNQALGLNSKHALLIDPTSTRKPTRVLQSFNPNTENTPSNTTHEDHAAARVGHQYFVLMFLIEPVLTPTENLASA